MDDYNIRWEYFDCGDSVGRYGTDGPVMPPIPEGCVEITYERYQERLAGIQAANDQVRADMVAADQQAADDRVTDLVAAKVAEILDARGTSV